MTSDRHGAGRLRGLPDFLKEPGEPNLHRSNFFPIFAVTFNDAEEEGGCSLTPTSKT
jgi:hypothetical protein